MSTAARRQPGRLADDGGHAAPVPLVATLRERCEEVIAQERGERQRRAQLPGSVEREQDVLEPKRHRERCRLELRGGEPRRVAGGNRRVGEEDPGERSGQLL